MRSSRAESHDGREKSTESGLERYQSGGGDEGLIFGPVLAIIAVIVIIVTICLATLPKGATQAQGTYLLGLLLTSLIAVIVAFVLRVFIAKTCFSVLSRKGFSQNACLAVALASLVAPLLVLVVCLLI